MKPAPMELPEAHKEKPIASLRAKSSEVVDEAIRIARGKISDAESDDAVASKEPPKR